MPVATAPNRGLAKANRIKEVRALQRAALRSASPADVAAAIRTPSPELASYRLRDLFATESAGGGVIPRFGRVKLHRALQRYNATDGSHRPIHAAHRLRELTERERKGVAAYILAGAPRSWKQRSS